MQVPETPKSTGSLNLMIRLDAYDRVEDAEIEQGGTRWPLKSFAKK